MAWPRLQISNPMMTIIDKPKLDPKGEEILERLTSRGWNVSWATDPDLAGYAASDMDEQRIVFRDQPSSGDCETILHELLHFDLFDKGYPFIKSKSSTYQSGVYILNDVFQHIIMKPEIERAGFSIMTLEVPATLKLIGRLANNPPMNEPFWAALYMRGHFLHVEGSKLALLEKHIRENHNSITMDKIIKAISQLPRENFSAEKYARCQNEVLKTLGLGGEVVIYKKK